MSNSISDYLVVSDIDGTLLQAGYGVDDDVELPFSKK